MKYTITSDAATVIVGGETKTVRRGAVNFEALCAALREKRWVNAEKALTAAGAVDAWSNSRFRFDGGDVTLDGKPVPKKIAARINAMASRGEGPASLFRFYERLSRNPSHRSVSQLFDFLEHESLPIESAGTFLAYKAVRRDYTDIHSAKVSNAIGQRPSMPRNEISDDADLACHVGFHVGALSYAQGFVSSGQPAADAPPYRGDGRIIVCRVDPEHVVCVPKDSSFAKVRVCEYLVVGHCGDPLPSTTTPTVTIEPCDEEKLAYYQNAMNASLATLVQCHDAFLRGFARDYLFVVGELPSYKLDLIDLILRLR